MRVEPGAYRRRIPFVVVVLRYDVLAANPLGRREGGGYTGTLVHDGGNQRGLIERQIPQVCAADVDLIHEYPLKNRVRRRAAEYGLVHFHRADPEAVAPVGDVRHRRQRGDDPCAEISSATINRLVVLHPFLRSFEEQADPAWIRIGDMAEHLHEHRQEVCTEDVAPHELRDLSTAHGLDDGSAEEVVEQLRVCEPSIAR